MLVNIIKMFVKNAERLLFALVINTAIITINTVKTIAMPISSYFI